MSSYEGDAAILGQVRELAAGLSDDPARKVLQNVVDALALNPQPLPPGTVEKLSDALKLNPQPLPPENLRSILDVVALNPQPIPPG